MNKIVKGILQGLLASSIIFIVFIIIMYLTQCFAYRTWVGKWCFQSEVVKDTTFYGGEYVKINDSIRIAKKNVPSIKDEEFVIQLKIGTDSFANTYIHSYYSIHNGDKWRIIRELQSEYEVWLRELNKPKTFFK